MSGEQPLVSVVIPTYNRAALLRRAVRSVVDQTMTDWELVVVDNHSRDETDAVLAAFDEPRLRVIKIHNDGIIAASRNRGLAAARGAFVAFLDADDWWTADKLEVAVQALGGGADICFHDMWRVKTDRQRMFVRRVASRPVTAPVYQDLVRRGNAIVTSSVVARTALLRQIGGMSEERALIASEDFDCWLRMARLTDRFQHLPGVHGYYQWDGGNMTNAGRALVHLRRLRELHLDPAGGPMPAWWLYAMGRAAYVTGDRQQARMLLRDLLWRATPFTIKAKTAYMLVMSLVSSGGPSGARA